MAENTKNRVEFLLDGDIEPISNEEIDEICKGVGEIITDSTGSIITDDDIHELFEDGDLSDNEENSSIPSDIPDPENVEPISDNEINDILNS